MMTPDYPTQTISPTYTPRIHPTANQQHVTDRMMTRMHASRTRNRQIGAMAALACTGFVLVVAAITVMVSHASAETIDNSPETILLGTIIRYLVDVLTAILAVLF